MDRHGRDAPSLVADLKRRGVLQTLGVYLVAAWAGIEVASTVFPYLGISDRAVTAIIVIAGLGIPVVGVLAWIFEVTPDGLGRTAAGGDASAPLVRVGWGRLPMAVGVLVVAASVAGLVWTRFFAPPAPDLGSVAVFPFNVQGDREAVGHLGEGMVTLLSRELDGAAGLRSTDPNTVLSLAEKDPRTVLDPRLARVVANEIGAAQFVLGTVTEVSGRIALSARLYGQDEGVEPVVASAEGTVTAAFELARGLIAQLLAQQVGPVSREMSRTAARDTESLAAFKAFVDAERELRANRRDEAIAGFQRAVTEDPAFALAFYRLAVVAGLRRNYRLVDSALDEAMANADRLSDRDRRLLDAFVALRQGRIDEAEVLYVAIIEDHPDAWEARFQLGEMLTEHNPARGRPASEGLPLLEALTRVDPAFVCPGCTLANHALSRADIDLADSIQYARVPQERFREYAAASAAARNDSVDFARWHEPRFNFFWQGPWLAAWFGAYDWAERLAQPVTEPSRNESMRVHGLFMLADLYVARGRWRQVPELLDRASEIAPGRARLRRAFYFTQPLAAPVPEALDEAIREIQAWSGTDAEEEDLVSPLSPLLPQARAYLLGLLEARRGAYDRARAWADTLDRAVDPPDVQGIAHDLALTVRADVELREGRASEALGLLERMRAQIPVKVMDLVSTGPARLEIADLFTQEHARLLRIEALLELGREREALRWASNGFFRIGGNALLAPTLRKVEGDVLYALGDTSAARERYEDFLALWAGAEGDVSVVADSVRDRIGALGSLR